MRAHGGKQTERALGRPAWIGDVVGVGADVWLAPAVAEALAMGHAGWSGVNLVLTADQRGSERRADDGGGGDIAG